MELKLFSKGTVVTRDDMHSPNPNRDVTIHNDHASAGYKSVGKSDAPAPEANGTLYIYSEGGKRCRWENGEKWEKE